MDSEWKSALLAMASIGLFALAFVGGCLALAHFAPIPASPQKACCACCWAGCHKNTEFPVETKVQK